MAQKTITSFFNSRKRPAAEDLINSKNKIAHIERISDASAQSRRKISVAKRNEIASNDLNFNVSSIKQSKADINETSEQKLSTLDVQPDATKQIDVFTKKINASNVVKPSTSAKFASISSARKELSLGDIRKKLAGSSRLAELKATADRLSKGIELLRESSKKPNLKGFKSFDVDVPISPNKIHSVSPVLKTEPDTNDQLQRPFISPRKVIVSPIKSPNKVPAYIRHAALVTSNGLNLPHHYRYLAELFRSMETVVALLYNRNEKITFNKLKPSIQEMLKKTFTEKHLSQIKHLVPDFYHFDVKKIKNFSTSSQNEGYELLISPNIPNDIKTMNPTVLLERRRYFYDTLLQLVKKHHAQYLSTLDPPMIIPDDKLVRWHPEFEIEKVPEIDCAKLPEMPNVEKLSTAQDVLAKARELFKCNTKMERALERLSQANAQKTTVTLEEEKLVTSTADNKTVNMSTTSTQTNAPTTMAILNPALRNLPTALLEKVKAKQAAKAFEAMMKTSENEEKYFIYNRLPDLARTLRNIFVTEKKNVLALNIVLSKLDSSFKANVSAADLRRDIDLLTSEVSEFVKWHEIRNNTYLKLDKSCDLNNITSKLEAAAVKYKNN